MFCTDNTALLHNVSSCSNRSFMMLRAGSMSTEVNNAVMLNQQNEKSS